MDIFSVFYVQIEAIFVVVSDAQLQTTREIKDEEWKRLVFFNGSQFVHLSLCPTESQDSVCLTFFTDKRE